MRFFEVGYRDYLAPIYHKVLVIAQDSEQAKETAHNTVSAFALVTYITEVDKERANQIDYKIIA